MSRLDVPTSGLLPVALGSEETASSKWFKAQFASRLVQKEYLCLCHGRMEVPPWQLVFADLSLSLLQMHTPAKAAGEQRVELPLRVAPSGPGTSRAQVDPLGREAVTFYESRATYALEGEVFSLVCARPKTGRASVATSLSRMQRAPAWLSDIPCTLEPRNAPDPRAPGKRGSAVGGRPMPVLKPCSLLHQFRDVSL